MGQDRVTASADAVRTLLDRVAARMRWGRARDVAGKVSLVALAVVIVEGLVARIVPLPSWQPVLVTLAVVPLAAGVVLLLRAPPERAVRRTAGDWIDTPSLFLSSSGSRKTALHPLVANAASRAPAERIVERTRTDKKRIGGQLKFILPRQIGRVEIVEDISEEEVRASVEYVQEKHP